MKNCNKSPIMLLIIALFATISLGAGYVRSEFMSVEEAQKKWGHSVFDTQKFRTGNEDQRAQMAVSLIESKKFIQGPIRRVLDELGTPNGYYFSESVPAYLIDRNRTKKNEVWQLVFLPDSSGKIIQEIKIHKNCCY